MTRSLTSVLLLAVTLLMIGDFVFRGVVPARNAGKNDFSDPYVGACLWRHGQNPYDVARVTATAKQLTHSDALVVPIYPPTAYVLILPFTFLPWEWANLLWALLSVLCVGITAWAIAKIGKFPANSDMWWFAVAFVFAFAPFHTGIHVANPAAITIACCLLSVYLAMQRHDVAAGILLAAATGLKPQLGIWIFLFYLLRRRWRIVWPGVLAGTALIATALARIPLSIPAFAAAYREDLHYWFGPGGQNDFTTANLSRWPLMNLQVALYPLLKSAYAANFLAYGIAISGVVLWAYAVYRGRARSETLAVSSLLALSFLAVYHRVNDTGILMLALCWAFSTLDQQPRWTRRATIFLMTLLLLPGQAVLARTQPHLPLWMTSSLWWNALIAPYGVWVLFGLSAVLLYSLVSLKKEPYPETPDNSGLGLK